MAFLLAYAVVASATSAPVDDAMARYTAITRAVVACNRLDEPTTITVCGRDRTAAAQRLPLPDEIVRDGPRIRTGDFPTAAEAAAPCTTGCYVGIDLKKIIGIVGKVADHLVTGSDLTGPP